MAISFSPETRGVTKPFQLPPKTAEVTCPFQFSPRLQGFRSHFLFPQDSWVYVAISLLLASDGTGYTAIAVFPETAMVI